MTAGGTREAIDPVRFIGNRSSGKQGYAVARVAAQRGAEVTLIAGHTAGLIDPAGVDVVHVSSAEQLGNAVSKHAPDADVLVMAAAVADFRPAQVSAAKIKKGPDSRDDAPTIELVRNDDVLAGAVRARTHGELPNLRAIVGFAAETGDANGDVLFHARAKLRRKGCDLLVVNAVGDGRHSRWTTTTAGCWRPTAPSRHCSTAPRRRWPVVLWTRSSRSCGATADNGLSERHLRAPAEAV